MKGSHRATIAEEDVLTAHGCRKRIAPKYIDIAAADAKETQFLDSLTHANGWEFTSHHTKILNESELHGLSSNIKRILADRFPSLKQEGPEWISGDSMEINKCKLHLPPMLFGNDTFQIKIGNSILEMNAGDAMLSWAAQHSEEEVNIHPLHVIKVPYAAKWTARMNDGFGIGMGIGKSSPATTDSCSVDTVPATKLESDWTFSSDYVCSLVNESPSTDGGSYEGVVLRARELPTPAAAATATTKDQATGMPCVRSSSSKDQSGSWRIECAVESGVDYSMLRRQDEPILFYDEFLLYQDDLEDCGEVSFEAKIRVMPSCWFLLTRQFLRVDGALVRCRETRLFHKFTVPEAAGPGSSEVQVHMEVFWRELAVTSPQQQHISTGPAGTVTPPRCINGATAATFGTTIPAARLPPSPVNFGPSALPSESLLMGAQGKNMTHLIPLVNEKENIHQYFTLSVVV